ncbi:MAG: cobalamin-binding protein [Nitrososphaeraceae archaeon]|nr:cobalamin-binding protein [Nitrososphaeraceae archaeon]
MQVHKIVSFLPSATEILYELGAGHLVVGVTHECNYPQDAKIKPKVINSSFDDADMTSKEIDNKISEISSNKKDIHIVNEELLKELKPDLIIAQGICAVCSPSRKEIDLTRKLLGYNPKTVVLDPHNLNDILTNIIEISEKIDRIDLGKQLVQTLKEKMNSIHDMIAKINDISSSKVLCLEWIEPFFTAGHWVPQMVEIAGGKNLSSNTGERSRRITIDEIKNSDPDKIILMPCGFDAQRTLKEYDKILRKDPDWNLLRAVRNKQIYIVDSGAFFSKPGPRTFTGIEILAKIIYPAEFADILVPSGSFIKIN